MQRAETDPDGVPIIRGLNGHIVMLARRREHLEEELQAGRYSTTSRTFLVKEAQALRAAEIALTYHRATISGLDQPMGTLRELVDAAKKGDRKATAEAIRKAELVLLEYSA